MRADSVPATRLAPAKINLSLEVLGTRPDGFHRLLSVMQTVTLFDRLTFASSSRTVVRTGDPQLQQNNLVGRALDALAAETDSQDRWEVELEKAIPVGGGLGGGSSDAATALLAARDLGRMDVSAETLHRVAAMVGSDVPFFLRNGTALVGGRGELVAPLPEPKTAWYVLARPGLRVPTSAVFDALPQSAWSGGEITRRVAESIERDREVRFGINGLAETLFGLYPEARRCYEYVAALATRGATVSGTGPTCAGLFDHRDGAHAAAGRLAHEGYWTAVASSYSGNGTAR
ncbi:MAG: 4-(cytidine 5'-diphospho)-2-C-methyl-D-erythritol kinase [Chloroflexota bacterium]